MVKVNSNKLTLIDPELEAELIAMEIGAQEVELSEEADVEPRQSPIATAKEIAAEVRVDIGRAVQEGVI